MGDQLQDILDSATVPVAVNQIEYNPSSHDENVISFCHQRNITVEAWSPLVGGSGGKTVFGDSTIQSIASSHGVSAAQVGLFGSCSAATCTRCCQATRTIRRTTLTCG